MTVEITSAEELRELLGAPMPRAVTKERVVLHERDRQWLAASPFCLVATAGADGSCDVSPKGDPPGFVKVLDEVTLAIPERPGNRRADGYRNILENPHVGLIFVIPGRTDTLRINGRARLIREAPWFDDMVVRGHRPILAIEVVVEQIFYHCAKAFLRSELWQPQIWQPDVLPPRPRLVKEVESVPDTLAELERRYGPEYLKSLYR
ncbi:pyridoxamine 5'-phosphate oxidase family protein [Micromonospora sp. KC213]|uniref:pyridoxamine 5'-phosphate oxidase family protein n=1 Tax=Micromonospora sp. KC213 TaxID=2530378 RepID=UPI001045F247|nr:pyridoxamine 5'-phosphate oxidase family protein [Micromonospora sp. KC213]TDC35604.1 pyridoxamine 5'-phosphate oxidase family protein [Micromonospora sp. KC213]